MKVGIGLSNRSTKYEYIEFNFTSLSDMNARRFLDKNLSVQFCSTCMHCGDMLLQDKFDLHKSLIIILFIKEPKYGFCVNNNLINLFFFGVKNIPLKK